VAPSSGQNASDKQKRVLSGMRPTGRLHIGHYFGALQNWVDLQNSADHECFFFVADWHALTTDYADTSSVAQNSIEIATDWLAAGLDPEKCTMFLQSAVREHAELHLLLSMITPLGWLERVPTYKEALENIKDKDLHQYGFLGYPVLQTADIVMYGEPGQELAVPVGEDQVSHIELSREIVRRFNTFYGLDISRDLYLPERLEDLREFAKGLGAHDISQLGWAREIAQIDWEKKAKDFVKAIGYENALEHLKPSVRRYLISETVLMEPEPMLTRTPRIPGTDGRKMSKSYGNFISLSESNDSIRTKTRAMMTDPARKRRSDPGNPDVCPVFDWHKLFPEEQTPEKRARVDRISLACRTAEIGCVECKGLMAEALIEWIEPVRARREQFASDPDGVLDILGDGSAKARGVARKTMARVREAVFGWEKTQLNLAEANLAAKTGKETGR
jgi:tryptophanyl-tRNA synthetase